MISEDSASPFFAFSCGLAGVVFSGVNLMVLHTRLGFHQRFLNIHSISPDCSPAICRRSLGTSPTYHCRFRTILYPVIASTRSWTPLNARSTAFSLKRLFSPAQIKPPAMASTAIAGAMLRHSPRTPSPVR